ncbi:MAG: FecR domain-containing protein [Bacteroidota bacterium]
MKITEELLQKYAAGKCTKEEEQLVKNWLESEGDNDGEDQSQLFGPYKEEIWEDLRKETVNAPRLFGNGVFRYAAAIVLLISVGTAAYLYVNSSVTKETQIIVSIDDYKTMEAPRGKRQTIELPDGSTVKLNSGAQLKFPDSFNGPERVVYLEGHAHFDVARNPEQPFTIYTDKSKTQVLGTSFDIKTSAESDTQIIVTSGKVAFSDRNNLKNKVNLTVNKRAILGADTQIAVDEVDASKLTAWRENRLIFEKMTLAEIIKVVEPWYDVNIKVENTSLLTIRYKLSKDNPTLEALMDDLSLLGSFEYELNGKTVTIY